MFPFKTGVVITGNSRGAVSAVNQTVAAQDKLKRATDKITASTDRYTQSITQWRRAIGGLIAGFSIQSLIETETRFDAIESAMTVGIGTAERAGRAFEFMRSESERLGLDLLSSSASMAQLQAAAQETILEGRGAAEIFQSIAEASTALGLSAYQTEGALRAIEQMISKGNVQAEELRGQLGERLPGAFQIAAAAMGVSTEKLNDMLEEGEVLATDLLPKLADELENRFAEAAVRASDNLRQNINRMVTSFTNLRDAVNDAGIGDALNTSVKALTDFTDKLSAVIRAEQAAFAGDPILDWAEVWRAGTDQAILFFARIPDFVKASAILIVNEVAYLAQATGLNFQAMAVLGERAWLSIKDAAIIAVDAALATIQSLTSGAASVLDALGADALSESLRTAAGEIGEFRSIIAEQSDANKARLDAERDAIVSAQEANRALRDAVITDVAAVVAANEDARQAAIDAAGSIKRVGLEAFDASAGMGRLGDETGLTEKELRKLAKQQAELAKQTRIYELVRKGMSLDDATFQAEYEAATALEQKIMSLKRATDELADARKEAEKDYRDSVKETFELQSAIQDRIDAALDADKFSDTAADIRDALGSIGDPIVELVDAFDRLNRISQNYAEGLDAIRDKEAKGLDVTKELSKLQTNTLRAGVGAYASLADAASGFFDETSRGYKTLQAVSQAAHAAELAMVIKELAPKATSAILSALAAPFPVNFAAGAAMAAIVAGLGVGVGGSVGSAPTGAAASQRAPGTGTVLGDQEAMSESIANSIEQLVDLQDTGLRVERAQLDALRSIDSAIRGVAQGLAQNFAVTGNATPIAASGSESNPLASFASGIASGRFNLIANVWDLLGLDDAGDLARALDIGAPLLGDLLDGLFSGFSQVKDTGLFFEGGQTLGELLAGELIDGFFYATVRTGRNDIFGGDFDVHVRDQLQALDRGTAADITAVFVGLGQTVLSAAEALGVDIESAREQLSALTLSDLGLDKISLEGLSAAEIQERLSAVFSSIGDQFAETILPAIDQFQRVGEGAYETLVRVASQTAAVSEVFDLLGVELRQTTGVTQIFMGEIADGIWGVWAESITRAANELETAQVVQNLSDLSGGFDALAENLTGFLDLTMSEAEQFDLLQAQLADLFAEYGAVLPATEDGLADVIAGFNLMTSEGQAAAAAISAASGSLTEYYEHLADLEADRLALTAELQNRINQLTLSADQLDQLALDETIAEWYEEAERLGLDTTLVDQLAALERQQLAAAQATATAADAYRYSTAAARDAEQAALAAQRAAEQRLAFNQALLDELFLSQFAGTDLELAQLELQIRDLTAAAIEAGGDLDLVAQIEELRRANILAAAAARESADAYQYEAASAEAFANIQEQIAQERYGLETQLLQLQGDTAALRARELEQLDPSNRELQERIWLLQDEQAISQERYALETQLLQLLGDTDELRRRELEQLDPSNHELQQRIWSLQDEQEAARAAADAQQDYNDTLEDPALQERLNLEQQLLQLVGAEAELRRRERMELDAANQSIYDHVKALEDQKAATDDAVRTFDDILSSLRSFRESLDSTYADAVGMSLAEQRSAFALVANSARLGNIEALQDLPQAGQALADASLALAGSRSEYLSDIANIQRAVLAAEGVAERQKSIAEESFGELAKQTLLLAGIHGSLEDLRGGAVVPAFASGGYHSGGLALVGEDGPEIVSMGPSHVFDASQTSSMLDSAGVIAELRRLHDRVEALQAVSERGFYAVAKHTEKSASNSEFLEEWHTEGLPPERAA